MQRTVKDLSDRWSQTTRANVAAMKTLGRAVNRNEELLAAQNRSLGALRGALEAVASDHTALDAALSRLAADQLACEAALDALDRELGRVLENRLAGAAAPEREGLVHKAQELLRRAKGQDEELGRAVRELNLDLQRADGAGEGEGNVDGNLTALLNCYYEAVALLELRLVR